MTLASTPKAHRVLKPGGGLLIAEVHSRIASFDDFEKVRRSIRTIRSHSVPIRTR
jgi:hypothetical protein